MPRLLFDAGTGAMSIQRLSLSVTVLSVISFLTWLFKRRMFYRRVPSRKLPHSMLMGHALVIDKEIRDFPADLHPDMGFVSLIRTYNLWDQEILYLDLSPFVNLSLCLPTTAEAVAAIHSAHLKKSGFLAGYNGRIIGLRGIVLAEGKEWKDMRATYNPGFSAANTMAGVPDMVDEVEVFVNVLKGIARKDGFVESVEIFAKRLSFDIIMQAVLAIKSKTQITPHPLGELMRTMSLLPGDTTSLNPLHLLNFIKPLKMRYYEWKIKQWLRPVILKRWEEIKTKPKEKGRKMILDMALEKERDERIAANILLGGLSEDSVGQLVDTVKSFIFGGHDTTASTVAWVIYELFRNPVELSKLREEHTSVFGSELSNVAATLKADPHRLNKLPFTTAVIKECMRLYPVAGSLQAGPPDTNIFINDTSYPISSQLVHISQQILNRNPKYYPSVDSFIPDRFMACPPAGFPPISNDAYRPFERLPRNCIGQEMAMLELKMILVLVSRSFDFSDGYAELDRRLGRKNQKGLEFAGGRAYMTVQAGNKPKDGIPMWVKEVVN